MANIWKTLILTLRVLGYVWIVAALVLILAGTIGVLIRDGFWEAMWFFSPFNFWNFLAIILTLAPGVAFLEIARRLSDRATHNQDTTPQRQPQDGP